MNINANTKGISLGIRGENNANTVVFDLSNLIAEYGEGTAVLLAKRSADADAYPVADITQDGNTLTWIISNVDTAYAGAGQAELFWYVDEVLAKSIVYRTYVKADIGATGEAPDPYETWLETLTELGAETTANAEQAQASAESAEISAERAEAAVPLSANYAVLYNTTQHLTEAQKATARNNIGANSGGGGGSGSNPNQLLNGWFTVNQRKVQAWSSGYGVDMWIANGSVTVNSDKSLTLASGASISQKFEFDYLTGRTVTASAIVDGEIVSVILSPVAGQSVSATESGITFTLDATGTFLTFTLLTATSVIIKAVKVEIGTESTLSKDAPPNYANEFAACQRYFQRIYGSAGAVLGFGYTASSEMARVFFTAATEIRDNGQAQTVAPHAGTIWLKTQSGNKTNLSSTWNYIKAGSAIGLVIGGSGFTANQWATINFNTPNDYIDISAEL